MMLDGNKYSTFDIASNAFSHRYKTKKVTRVKYLAIPISIVVISMIIFSLSSLDIGKKEKSQPVSLKNKTTSTTSAPTNNAEVCSSTSPLYGGNTMIKCLGDSYAKYHECFTDQQSFETAILNYSLTDETFLSDGVLLREGEISNNSISQYRIMASFNNTRCIIDLTSSIANKDMLLEVFEDNKNSEIAKNNSFSS